MGRSMKGERAKEGGRRKGLGLEQIPAYLRFVDAKYQLFLCQGSISSKPQAEMLGPSQTLGVVIFSQHRAALFVCLTEFKLSGLPGAPTLFIHSHLP